MTLKELVATFGLRVNPAGFKQADRALAGVAESARQVGAQSDRIIDGVAAAGGLRSALLGIGAIAAGIKIGAGIKGIIDELVQGTGQLQKTGQQLGLTAQQVQSVEYAGQASGVEAGQLTSSLLHLGQQIRHLGLGSKEAAIALSGINFRGTDGKIKRADDLLESIADKFAKLPDGIEKTTRAQAIFGDGGAALIPLLNKGSEGIRAMRAEVRALGAEFSAEDIAAAADYRKEMSRLGLVSLGLKQAIGGPLIRGIADLNKQFTDWVKAQQGDPQKRARQGFEQLALGGQKLLGVMKALFSVVTWALQFSDVLAIVVAGFAVATVAATIFGNAALLANIKAVAVFIALGAAITVVFLLYNSLFRYLQGKDSLIGDLVDAFNKWLEPKPGDSELLKKIKAVITYVLSIPAIIDDAFKKIETSITAVLDRIEAKLGPLKKVFQVFRGAGQLAYEGLPPNLARSIYNGSIIDKSGERRVLAPLSAEGLEQAQAEAAGGRGNVNAGDLAAIIGKLGTGAISITVQGVSDPEAAARRTKELIEESRRASARRLAPQ